MKKVILFVVILVCSEISVAQCDKTSVLSSSQTEYLDSNHTVQRTVDEKSVIEITKSEVIITHGNDQQKMIGTIKSDSCTWKNPFKEGKSIIKATFTRDDEKPMNATITIEGKEEKVIFFVEIKEMPDKKIRVIADKFEEKI